MAERTAIDAMKVCDVEGQHGMIQTTVWLAIRSVPEKILNENVAAAHMQQTAMRADAHPTMIKAAAKALLVKHEITAAIVKFESN